MKRVYLTIGMVLLLAVAQMAVAEGKGGYGARGPGKMHKGARGGVAGCGVRVILKLKDEALMDRFASDRSKTWRTLDVSILHKIILEYGMGITQDNLEDHVKYTRDDKEAIKFVDNNKFDLSFLMNATKIDELKAIADAGEHMPQKSTYFLPKMLSGLVMYQMDL